jgi:predicted ABC-type exoprotein transport system permease subunit
MMREGNSIRIHLHRTISVTLKCIFVEKTFCSDNVVEVLVIYVCEFRRRYGFNFSILQ